LSDIIYPTIQQLEKVFFEGSLQGWCTGKAPRQTSDDLPGWKIIKIPVDDFLYIDCYTVGFNGYSQGCIEIRRNNDLFWMMQFGGQYTKQAIKVVKKALKVLYEHRVFQGGRGSRFFITNRIIYENFVHDSSCFEKFRGKEEVYDRENRQPLGYHWYCGGLTFDPK